MGSFANDGSTSTTHGGVMRHVFMSFSCLVSVTNHASFVRLPLSLWRHSRMSWGFKYCLEINFSNFWISYKFWSSSFKQGIVHKLSVFKNQVKFLATHPLSSPPSCHTASFLPRTGDVEIYKFRDKNFCVKLSDTCLAIRLIHAAVVKFIFNSD